MMIVAQLEINQNIIFNDGPYPLIVGIPSYF